jgi:glycosyltransferase involved in cell wall biosynthesis
MLNTNAPVPSVSILMPTFKHAPFIRRAIESLQAQTFTDWELIIVDDASPDNTSEIVSVYLGDDRFRYYRLPTNQGVGAALNFAMAHARGRYIAYLSSDDLYYPQHLARLVDVLDNQPEIYLAYGGVRWRYQLYTPTLQGAEAVGNEAHWLANPLPPTKDNPLPSGNLFAPIQVMHRRDYENGVRWQTRAEIVTDKLERDFWHALAQQGISFGYTGEISCEWVEHPNQHHRLIAGHGGGLARYRQYYNIE